MSSHDSAFDGGIGFGLPGGLGLVADGDPLANTLGIQASPAGGLTLDEAESIAARRLQELAIRLNDDDAESVDDEPGLAPFDADRHLRTRLARRLANREASDDADTDQELISDERVRPLAETGLIPRYGVSEALPLSAFGDGLVALSYGRLALPALPPPAKEGLAEAMPAVEPAADIVSEEARVEATDDAAEAGLQPQMRLVDLIKEQRDIVDRLSRFGESGAAVFATTEAGLATGPVEAARSDAEELFEAGTFAPNSIRALDELGEVPRPVALSAEQLIAALKEVMPDTPEDEEEPAPADGIMRAPAAEGLLLQNLVHRDTAVQAPQLMRHDANALPAIANGFAVRPLSGLAYDEREPVHGLAGDSSRERAPIIIERARAEMTALANGTALRVTQPSAAIGFFVGLSLSLVCGVGLYFVL